MPIQSDGAVGGAGDAGQGEVDPRRGGGLHGGVHRAVEVEELLAAPPSRGGSPVTGADPLPREGREAQQLGPAPRAAAGVARRAGRAGRAPAAPGGGRCTGPGWGP